METTQVATRIHPLVAGAAASVMLVSLLGAAAITGILPTSRGMERGVEPAAQLQQPSQTPMAAVAAVPAVPAAVPAVTQPAQPAAQVKQVVHHRTVVHHKYVQQSVPATPQPRQVAQPRYSPVGIATGAVVGGLIGNQVGGGNGRTLATIAGAVGGGYVGNEIANRY